MSEIATKDENGVPCGLAQDSTDSTKTARLQINPSTWALLVVLTP